MSGDGATEQPSPPGLFVVVPAYNEARASLPTLDDSDCEIIGVDDGDHEYRVTVRGLTGFADQAKAPFTHFCTIGVIPSLGEDLSGSAPTPESGSPSRRSEVQRQRPG